MVMLLVLRIYSAFQSDYNSIWSFQLTVRCIQKSRIIFKKLGAKFEEWCHHGLCDVQYHDWLSFVESEWHLNKHFHCTCAPLRA